MKWFVLLLSVLACWSVASVNGQTTNYLLASYDSAMFLKYYYDYEVQSFRQYATWEAEDMGYYFTEIAAGGIGLATSAGHGAGIRSCISVAVRECQFNINFMDRYIVETEHAANDLHKSVMDQLVKINIKEYDLELFYYYHNYVMEDAYQALWYVFWDNMFYSYYWVYIDFFYNYEFLYTCIAETINYGN